MATTNPVSQVLVTSGDQALLAAGSRVDALAPGQLGVFNYHTGLSLAAASITGDTRDIFIAVGLDPDGTDSLTDIGKSAGQVIQVRNAKTLTVKGAMVAQAKVIDVTGFTAKCDRDYALKIEFRNSQIYGLNGYNQFTKTFGYHTGCCADDCDTCGDGNCGELALGLLNAINADPDGLATAQLIDYTTTGTGDDAVVVATGSEYDAWIADVDNAGKCLGLRITSVPSAINKFGAINLKYYNLRGTDMIISTADTFTCNGTITTYKELIYSQGAGYDIQQLEYLAGGWNGRPGPYRVSTLTNTERGGIVYYADKAGSYIQVALTYDQQSVGGWLEYLNNLETIVAIPCADTTTRTSLGAVLTAIFTQFPTVVADFAAASCDSSEVHTTDDPATDGIDSISG